MSFRRVHKSINTVEVNCESGFKFILIKNGDTINMQTYFNNVLTDINKFQEDMTLDDAKELTAAIVELINE